MNYNVYLFLFTKPITNIFLLKIFSADMNMNESKLILLFAICISSLVCISTSEESPDKLEIDPNGYIVYCPCMGKCKKNLLIKVRQNKSF